jgi:glucokinase
VRCLGIDLGGTTIDWVVLDADDDAGVVARGGEETRAERGPDSVIETIAAIARSAVDEHGIVGIGLGMPGPLDLERGRAVFVANMPGWADFPIVERLERGTGQTVALLNDARAFTLAELRLGAGQGVSDLIGVTLGTGVGGGIVVGGRLLLGLNGTAGEIGHQTLDPAGPRCACGNTGCLEQYASGPAIARAAGLATAAQVVEAARAGDARARAVLAQAGAYLGIGIANVALAVAPELVVVGGGVSAAGELLLEPACAELRRRLTVMPAERIRLVPAALGRDAGAIGAALWASRHRRDVDMVRGAAHQRRGRTTEARCSAQPNSEA